MKKQPWLVFLEYPYSTLVLACIWIGSAVMMYIDRDLPVTSIVVVDIFAGWLITWLSFRPGSLK